MKFIAIITIALSLGGCAIAALPVASQVPLWGTIAGGAAAAGTLTVTAIHDCDTDPDCHLSPLQH